MNKKLKVLLSCTAVITAFAAWMIYGNTAVTVSDYEITSDALPESFSGFRIVQISDLHNAVFGEDNSRLIRAVEKSEPDIIVITGDMVDSRRTDYEVALDLAERIVRLAPVYYVTGNHEGRLGQEELSEFENGLTRRGVKVLRGEKIEIYRGEDKISVIGLDDAPTSAQVEEQEDEMPPLFNAGLTLTGSGFTVLLSHRPHYFEQYAASGVDLVFSGHAHGGQVRIPFIGGLYAPGQGFLPKYDAGIYTAGKTAMVVSRGLGNSICPIRFNDPPELVTVTLTSHE